MASLFDDAGDDPRLRGSVLGDILPNFETKTGTNCKGVSFLLMMAGEGDGKSNG